MPRPERPLNPSAGPKERFASELRQLRRSANAPSYKQMAERAHYSRTVLAEAAGGRTLPSWAVTRAFVLACGGDETEWEQRWAVAERACASTLDQHPQPAVAHGRRRFRRTAVITGVALLVVTAAALGRLTSTGGTMRSAFLGDVDLARFCRDRGYSSVSLDGTTPADWHCVRSSATKDSLSVTEACRSQYQRPNALARYADLHNPDSWQCWDDVIVIGRVDVDKYCHVHGYATVQPQDNNTDSWDCVTADGRRTTVDHDSACRWQYGSQVLVAGPGPFHSPWEHWDCWG